MAEKKKWRPGSSDNITCLLSQSQQLNDEVLDSGELKGGGGMKVFL
jgi:hypothetical protein